MTTQPKIDTSTGFLKIDCLNFDLMSSCDSENDSEDCAIMAPVVHERGQMSFFFELPTQEEIQEPKLTGKLEFQYPEPRRYSSATSERLAEDEDQGEELFNFELASVLSEEIDFDFHASQKSINEQPSSKSKIMLNFPTQVHEQDDNIDGEQAPIRHQRGCFPSKFELPEDMKNEIQFVELQGDALIIQASETKKAINNIFISQEIKKDRKDSMKNVFEASTNGSSILTKRQEPNTEKLAAVASYWQKQMQEDAMSDFSDGEELY